MRSIGSLEKGSQGYHCQPEALHRMVYGAEGVTTRHGRCKCIAHGRLEVSLISTPLH